MTDRVKITEQASLYNSLENMSTEEVLDNINKEDQKVPLAIQAHIPKIADLVDQMADKFANGGRLFYVGAGTSGRLGILDASEIPPTYGMDQDRVIGLIAGGDKAIKNSIEFAEDLPEGGKKDLEKHQLNSLDTVVGIAASGSTPYVIGALDYARSLGALTACITNNEGTSLAEAAEIAIEVVVGPEFVTGSTRMKSGTSQKLILNMISTTLMIKMGRVQGNKMINMQLNNKKLVKRGLGFLMEELGVSEKEASSLLKKHGSVSAALKNFE